MHYSVCIPAILGNKPLDAALSTVKQAGYSHYECWGWWDYDMALWLRAQNETGLIPAAICTRFVSLTDPAQRGAYLAGLEETVKVCHTLGCKTIISQVGAELVGVPREAQHQSIVDGLKLCAPLLETEGLTLVIEPLNTRINHKGYYLWQSQEAYDIVDEVGSPGVKVLYDIYHQYVMDDVDIAHLTAHIDKIGHFHMAGYPGRHEPITNSEIDYPTILEAIRQTGYEGCVGLEYIPTQNAADGLRTFLQQMR